MTDPLPAVFPFAFLLFFGSKQSVIGPHGETMCVRPGQQNGNWFGIDRELRPIRRYSWTLLLSSANQPKHRHKKWCFEPWAKTKKRELIFWALSQNEDVVQQSKMPSHRSHGWNIVPWRASTPEMCSKTRATGARVRKRVQRYKVGCGPAVLLPTEAIAFHV